MKRFLCFAFAVALVLSSLLIAGCYASSVKPISSFDSSVFADSPNLAGFYSFDSVATVENGSVSSAATLGSRWEGHILTEDYASILLKEDGSFVCSGAIQGDGLWGVDDAGNLFANVSLNNGEISSFGVDDFGLLFVDILCDDGTSLYLRFSN